MHFISKACNAMSVMSEQTSDAQMKAHCEQQELQTTISKMLWIIILWNMSGVCDSNAHTHTQNDHP